MWKERLIRIFLLAGATAVVLLGVKKISSEPKRKSIVLPKVPIEETLENISESVLGVKKKDSQVQETEPIKQPAENIQIQTQQLIESIKKLPVDQLEAVKKQLTKEFCEQLKKE